MDITYNHAPSAIYSLKLSAMAKLIYERMYSLSKDGSQVIFFKQADFATFFGVSRMTIYRAVNELVANELLELTTPAKKVPFDQTKYYKINEPKITPTTEPQNSTQNEQKMAETVDSVQCTTSVQSNVQQLDNRMSNNCTLSMYNSDTLECTTPVHCQCTTSVHSSLDRNKKEYISKNKREAKRSASASLSYSLDDIFSFFTQKANELKKDHLAIERMYLPTIAEKFFNFWSKKKFKFNLGLDGNITKWLLDECEHIESNLLRDTTSEEELKRKEQEENAERYTQRLMNERGWTREQVIQYDKDCTVNLPPLDPNEPLKRALGLI